MENKFIMYNNMIKQTDENGFYRLENDKLAIENFMLYVQEKHKFFDSYSEKLQYLIDNGYYSNLKELYDEKFILTMYTKSKNFGFEFKSFMACQKYYDSYSLKTFDKKNYLEDFYETVLRVSLYIAQGDEKYAEQLMEKMLKQEFQPATPTFLNAGLKSGGELVSCFLLDMDDSLNSINYNLSTAMQLSKIGGGVALNLSNLRARNESIRGVKGVCRGVLPVLKLLEDAFSYVDQLGQRPGAGAAYLSVFHADVLEFLDTKKINADEKSRIQTLSLGLTVPDLFFELCKSNQDINLFYPHSVYLEYNQKLEDMDLNVMYDKLVANPNVMKRTIKARSLLQKISMTQFESGYPYLVFIDSANRDHALKELGKIKISNLCTEIFQLQSTSTINDYGKEDEIGYDISCNLGSLNIVNLMSEKEFESTIYTATKALSQVSKLSNIENAPGVNKANNAFNAIGLGVMNLHGFLAQNYIMYESEEALDFCNVLFPIINYYSIMASNKLAIEYGITFEGFEKSEYSNGKYFKQYLEKEFSPKFDKVQNLFEGIKIPTIEDWCNLKNSVAEFGLYNGYRLAIAPTQSISYIQNSTASIGPIVDKIETRMYGNSQTYYPMPGLSPENILYYKSAYNMDQKKVIDLVSVIQPHIDQGISTVLYVTNLTTTKELAHLYYYAYYKGLKSLYYIRTKNLTIEECESCSV